LPWNSTKPLWIVSCPIVTTPGLKEFVPPGRRCR
jgi:hypothetical protein